MATGEPNQRGNPERPIPDDSLWEELPPATPTAKPRTPVPPPPINSPRDAKGKAPTDREGSKRTARGRAKSVSSAQGTAWIEQAVQLQPSPNVSTINPADQVEEENGLDILLGLAQNAPAWLISAVAHTTLLIVLGLCLAMVDRRHVVELNQGINLADQPGDSLESIDDAAPTAQRGTQLIEKNDSQVFAPQKLPQIDNPFATPPTLAPIGPGGILPASELHAPTIGLSLHGREGGMKGALLGIYGGTAGTESAVGRGLEWLAKQQRQDGMWSLGGPYTDGSAQDNQGAATAMALLAFQGAGITPSKGKYSRQVDKAWTALLKIQARDGSFGLNGPARQGLYTHAQCTIALCEILGMTHDARFYEPAQRAVAFCVAAQDKNKGGWRYDYPASDSDTSVTGWFVMALKSAQMAGLEVPQDTLYRVTQFLDSAQVDGGKYGYMPNSFSTPAVTAEAYLCRQLLGWKQDDPRLVDGCKLILAGPINYDDSGQQDVYYWYYATQVCHHMEGEIWTTWNNVMREKVPAHQVVEGPEYGSWDPKKDRWGGSAGRLYTTCLSIYLLEVYYRHLPLYSGYRYTAK